MLTVAVLGGCPEEYANQRPSVRVYLTNSTQDNIRLYSTSGPHVTQGQRLLVSTAQGAGDFWTVEIFRSHGELALVQISYLKKPEPFDPFDPFGPGTGDVVVDLILTEPTRDQFVVTFGEPGDAEWVQFNVLSRQ
jgi:hypothetical protein